MEAAAGNKTYISKRQLAQYSAQRSQLQSEKVQSEKLSAKKFQEDEEMKSEEVKEVQPALISSGINQPKQMTLSD